MSEIVVAFDVRCNALDHDEHPRRYRWNGKGPMPSKDEQGFNVASTGHGVTAHEFEHLYRDDDPTVDAPDATHSRGEPS